MNIRPDAPLYRQAEREARSSSARRLKSLIAGGVALVLLLGGYWYFSGSGDSGAGRGGGNVAPVRIAKVEKRDMAVIERSLGTVVANTLVQLTARVQGTMDKVNFKEGQFVRKGDLLFQIDPRPYQAALAQAQAIWRRDSASLLNAQRDKDRYASLSQQGAISDQQRASSETNAVVLEATVAADKAAVDMAQLNLEYTQIRSPVDGKTGPVLLQQGNMVSTANASTGALVTIAEMRPIKVSFTLPQSDLDRIQARLRKGPILAILDAHDANGQTLSAPVDFTGNVVSAQSGTIELRANFSNADLSLVPGQLVNVTVQLDDLAGALVVPRDAVNDSPNGSFIFRIKDGAAEQVPVKILFDDGTYSAVSGDLAAGDSVVIEGQLRVLPGGKVRVLGARGAAGGVDAGSAGGKRRGKRGDQAGQ